MSRLFSTTPSVRAADSRNIALTAAVIALLAAIRFAICLTAAPAVSWTMVGKPEITVVLLSVFFLAIGLYYAMIRREILLGTILTFPGFFLLSSIVSFQAQYIIFYMGRHNDLIDAKLAAIDAALGFDWPAYCKWMVAHPRIERITALAYGSIWLQPLLLSVIFCLKRRLRDYLSFSIAMPLSFVITCIVAAYLPALGAYQFHGMTPDQHAGLVLEFTDGMSAPMLWLRQGDFSGPTPSFGDLRLITFPSWHAAAAAIFMISTWSSRGFRWAGLILNVLMLLSTPVQGSHYLTDMIIGFAIGIVSCWIAFGLLKKPTPQDAAVDIGNMAPA